jgi:Carboxypeptidase regulatory-like domain
MFLRATAAFLLLVAFAFPISAQTPSGEISGVVSDSNGAVVAGVRVTLTNSATNAIREVQSNDSGLYAIPALPPGIYTLKVEKTGFRAVERRNIEVLVGSANRIDVALEVGEMTNTVEITGGAPVLQSENASIGTVIENRSIVELPLNGRNYLQLTSLIPGATTNGPSSSQGKQRMGGQRNSFALNVSGQRIHFNHYSLDGIENTDLNFNSYMLLPSVDALREFKVESGLFDAEYGRAIAQINVSTKSGTNQFHGTLFEFLRNSALDAKNYFDRPNEPIPPFKRNQYGATVSGPVILPKINGRDRLFFLFNWEGLRERKALTGTPSLPLTAWRNGDFSGLCQTGFDANRVCIPAPAGSSLSAIQLYDPATRVFDAAGNVITPPTAFRNNIIPIHPVSKKLLDFFPLPQQEKTGSNFVNNEARRIDADQFT